MTITERIRPYLETPHFDDGELQVRAQLLNIITLVIFAFLVLVPIVSLLSNYDMGESTIGAAALITLGILIVSRILLYRKQLSAAGYVFVIGGFLLLGHQSFSSSQGLYSPQFMATYILVLISAVILGTRQAVIVAVASILLGVFLFFTGTNVPLQPSTMLTITAIFLLFTVIIMYGVLNNLFNSLSQVKSTNEELNRTQAEIEQRIVARTRTLEIILSLSRELSLILDPDDLIREMVNQVRDAFDYYYTQIYLLDSSGNTLNVVAATGTAGQKLLSAGHTIFIGEGLVGQAAQENRPVLVANVKSSRQWLPNPHLPATRTEVAIPISIGDRVMGVLDVQHHTANSLTEEDISVLQTMANQAAISLQNAGLFTTTAQRAQLEAQINAFNEQIQQATSIESVLQIATEGLGKALPTKRTTVYLQPAGDSTNSIPVPNGARK